MDTVCALYLGALSSYHVVTGVLSAFFPRKALRFYREVYAYDAGERRYVSLMLRPWGALALFAGIAGLFAAVDPRRYFGVVLGLAILLGTRIGLRMGFEAEVASVLGIPRRRNRLNVALLALGVAVLGTWCAKNWP